MCQPAAATGIRGPRATQLDAAGTDGKDAQVTDHGGWSDYSTWKNVWGCTKTCGGGTQSQRRTRTCTNPAPTAVYGNDCTGSATETRSIPCNTNACPVVGGWSDWSSWDNQGSCSSTCGTDGTITQRSTRTCTNPSPANGGARCSGNTYKLRSATCNRTPCPIDGGWTDFSSWDNVGTCSVSCGGGVQTQRKTRSCTDPTPQYNGAACSGSTSQTRTIACNSQSCPVDGGWSDFSDWVDEGVCSAECGGGDQRQTRERTCTDPAPAYGGAECSGDNTQTQTIDCNTHNCPGVCSAECGGGEQRQTRERTCSNPAPAYGGAECSGDSTQTQTIDCNTHNCPVHGGWSDWTEFADEGECSVSCAGGDQQQRRDRECNSPTPEHGGRDCEGDSAETKSVPCNTHECPVHGGWSEWSDWTYEDECPVTCGGSPVMESRSRSCDAPAPAHGGDDCEGSSTENRPGQCNNNPCPVNGGWSDWSEWSQDGECSVSCGGGTVNERQNRRCDNPAPAHGGAECDGDDVNTRDAECNAHECPVDGGWSDWSDWRLDGQYTVAGNMGTANMIHDRTCTNPAPAFNGKECEGPSKEFTQASCPVTQCQGICDDSSATYAYPGEYTAYYGCNKAGQMAKKTCPSREHYNSDDSRCVRTCNPTGVSRKIHPGRKCNKFIFCVFGNPWEMPCFGQDANCPTDCVQ
ncbi:coadhesin-like [Haliotis rubra]|uniref:coadhesin-like n=1 Tax=Haliotis rubra TaxID=36100 RepID=UPI001EE61D29|nr:coadhesin-like [Haliotis rubra]